MGLLRLAVSDSVVTALLWTIRQSCLLLPCYLGIPLATITTSPLRIKAPIHVWKLNGCIVD